MRTNIVLDDKLISEAMKLARVKTKKSAVEEGLRLLIQVKRQEGLRSMRGKLDWQGDLEHMRLDA